MARHPKIEFTLKSLKPIMSVAIKGGMTATARSVEVKQESRKYVLARAVAKNGMKYSFFC